MARLIYLAHSSPGRTRLRLPWLRLHPDQAAPLADGLQEVDGIEEVEIRPYTGSVLCLHDPHALDVEALLAAVRRLTGVDTVVRPGEEPPEEAAELLRALDRGSGVARAASEFFKGLNVEVLRATDGRVDLGSLFTLGFVVAGATEVVVTRNLPFPPWFNLAWWGFRTFTTIEKVAIVNTPSPVRNHNGHAEPEQPGPQISEPDV